MNEISNTPKTTSPVQKTVNTLWPYVSGKRGKILLALAIVTAGMVLNWGWFVAIGVAPLIIALLPCAVMCAFGLCMNHGDKKSCSSKSDNRKKDVVK